MLHQWELAYTGNAAKWFNEHLLLWRAFWWHSSAPAVEPLAVGDSGFTSATLEAICTPEDARRDQALHLPGRVCLTLVKKKKSPGRNLPYAYASSAKARSAGLGYVFKLPFLFFFLVESTIGVRSQRGWFYLKVLWSWKSWDFYHFIFTKFRIQFCVW